MLARSAVRSVLTRRFTRRVPLLVWLKVALAQVTHGTTFEVIRLDPTVFPSIGYSLTSDSHSLSELRDLALYETTVRVPSLARAVSS